MQVKQLSDALSVSADTVRYYTRVGLLCPVKSNNGYKVYRPTDVTRLRFILSARNLGFSVKDIKQIIVKSEDVGSPCPTVRALIELRLKETEQRFNDMYELRNRMRLAIADWQAKPDQPPCAETICHLIESFAEPKTNNDEN